MDRVAIIGVGGTGSHVLDYVTKSNLASEIHVFDDDYFKNGLRAPGPFSSRIPKGVKKGRYHAKRYNSGQAPIVKGFNDKIDDTNVHRLSSYNTVFSCLEGSSIKRRILQVCMENGVLLIDVGMSVDRLANNNQLMGMICVTTCLPENYTHAEHCMYLDDNTGSNQNTLQSVELNALNAALAVIQWKQIRGVYEDLTREMYCMYVIGENALGNEYPHLPKS